MEANTILQRFYQLRKNETHFIRYQASSKSWIDHQCKKQIEQLEDAPCTVSTLSFNVLTDNFKLKSYRENMIHAKIRYAYILSQVQKNMPDVMSFNEVTQTFFEMLKQAKWAQQNYYISKLTVSAKGFGNLLCTKIEPIFVDKIYIPDLARPIQTAFLAVKKGLNKIKIVCFCSVHLTAFSRYVQRRDKQFTGIVTYLERYKDLIYGVILQGDMNFHNQSESFIFENHKFKDSWLDKYNLIDKPGYTFDGEQNSFINELYWGFQRRRMRLDRVLYKCPQLKVQQIIVIFDQPIYGDKKKVDHHMFFKGGLLAVGDFLGINWSRQKQKYLFPSDHYGLIAKLSFKQPNPKQ